MDENPMNSGPQTQDAKQGANRGGLSRRGVLNVLKGVGLGIGAAVIAGKDAIVAFAQQITGALGLAETPPRPSTASILPPPPPEFGGVIKETAEDSTPWWPPRVVPPKGAPNVLLIMTDDAGLRRRGTFGGVIPTPALDRDRQGRAALHPVPLDGALLADARGADHRPQPPLGRLRRDRRTVDRLSGLRLCHRSGERDDRHDPAETTATRRRGSARTTTRPAISTAPPVPSTNGRRAWASSISTASWAARPTSGRRTCSAITPRFSRGSASPTTTSSPTWRTRRSSTSASSTPSRPTSRSSSITCPAASHSPHQPTQEWIDKFKGKFDMGWNAMREQIFANQKRLGVIPANTELTALAR